MQALQFWISINKKKSWTLFIPTLIFTNLFFKYGNFKCLLQIHTYSSSDDDAKGWRQIEIYKFDDLMIHIWSKSRGRLRWSHSCGIWSAVGMLLKAVDGDTTTGCFDVLTQMINAMMANFGLWRAAVQSCNHFCLK